MAKVVAIAYTQSSQQQIKWKIYRIAGMEFSLI